MIARVSIALIAIVIGTAEPALADERLVDARPVGTRSDGVRPVEDPAVDGTPADHRIADGRSVGSHPLERRSLDRLGASRLFFTAEERYVATHGGADGFSGRPAGSMGDVPGDERDSGADPGRRTRRPARANESLSRGIVFQALLHAETRTQVVLDGRLCRAEFTASGGAASDAMPLSLHCAAMPAGVQAVQLLRAEKRLLITLSGGDRRRLALGDSMTSP